MWLISFLTGHQTLNQVSVVVHAENSTFFSTGGEYLCKIGNNIDNKLSSDAITIHLFLPINGCKVSTPQ